MIGGARTNGYSEQKAEDGRSFHRLSDGAITFLLRSTSLMLGTCGTCPDEACRSGFKAKTGVHRRPPIHTVPLGEARLSAYTSLPPGRAYGKPNYLLPSADRGYCLQAEQPGHCQLALRPFDVGADRKLGRLTRRRRHALSPPDRRADEALVTAADC